MCYQCSDQRGREQVRRKAIMRAIQTAPAGTAGWVVAPWSPHDVWGVAARWSDAAAPVYIYGDEGWVCTPYQAVDNAWHVFRSIMEAASDNDDVDAILAQAVGFHDRQLDD